MEAFRDYEKGMTANSSGDARRSSDMVQETVLASPGEVKPQVHFNLWSCLGMNFSISSTPLAIGTYLSLAVGVGVRPSSFTNSSLLESAS